VVSRLKTLCRILVRHRFLLSAGLSAAAGVILKSVVLIPVADPLFPYAALQRPGIYPASGHSCPLPLTRAGKEGVVEIETHWTSV
jgi:hypothetical protein